MCIVHIVLWWWFGFKGTWESPMKGKSAYNLRLKVSTSIIYRLMRCSVWTILLFDLVCIRDARWHDGENAMAWWYDGENAMVRWWKRNDTMMKSRWHDSTMVKKRCDIAFSPSYDREFTIEPSCFHRRTIAISSLCHLLPVVLHNGTFLPTLYTFSLFNSRTLFNCVAFKS
jgi:hypothetical protein